MLWSAEGLMLVNFFLLFVKSDEVRRKIVTNEDVNSRITYPNDFLFQQPEYHHHHHNPGYHGHRDFQNGHFVENNESNKKSQPSDSRVQQEKEQYSNSSMQIPVSFIKDINRYELNDLLLNFVEEEPFVSNRFGEDDDGARTAAKIPPAAGCAPEVKTILLAQSNDPSILYIPQCTRVERCGGCCSHNLLSCQPKETETLTYQVMKTQYTGKKKLKLLGKEIVVVEKHISCKCACKTKEEVVTADCNKYQEYRESECRCACTNTDEEKKCAKNSSTKFWNPDLCTCQCKEVRPCSTGYIFDHIECQCVAAPLRRRFANYDRRGYVAQADSVSPLTDE